MNNKLYIVLPAYNEEKNLENTICSWHKVFNLLDVSEDSKIVVFNDGSTDRTLEVGKELEKRFSNFKILDKINEGHGPTVIAAYKYAIENGADFVFQTDSDGQTNPNEFIEFWENRNEYDAIFGVRKNRGDGKSRVFVEKVVCLLVYIIFDVKVPDANAPFRLMRTEPLKKYLAKLPQDFNLPNIMLTTYFAYFEKQKYSQKNIIKNNKNIVDVENENNNICLSEKVDENKNQCENQTKEYSNILFKGTSNKCENGKFIFQFEQLLGVPKGT